MKNGKTAGFIVLCIAAVIAVLVPCLTLFEEGDWLYYVLREPAMHRAWIETAVLAAVTALGCLAVPSRRGRVIILALILLVVSYLHGMLVPVLLGGVYFLLLVSGGGLVTRIAETIVLAALLSLFHVCTPFNLFLVVTLTAFQNVLYFRKKGTGGDEEAPVVRAFRKLKTWMKGDSPLRERLLTDVIFLVVLVQIARANVCIDFDSLWYGVRSTFVLSPNGSIFEDLGLVGMVYTYPKGFEILTLPISGTSSYAVITAFNLCLFLYGLRETGRIAGTLAGEKTRSFAVLLTAMVPGIVNMTLSAKPDIITWVLQLVMLRIFFETVRSEEKNYGALRVLAVYLLSLTMKPTAIIFSTALFGMMSVYGGIVRLKQKKEKGTAAGIGTGTGKASAVSVLLLSAAAFVIVCARTFRLTGMPFTSVFTGIFEKLGFTLKYPFAAASLPQSYQEGPAVVTAVKRAVRMLLMPDGKDMSHVIIAWGGSLFFVLGVGILLGLISKPGKKKSSGSPASETRKCTAAALMVFLPFMAVCFITLMMLYQVDGNYYMMLYSIVIFLACMVRIPKLPVIAVCVFQFVIMTMTNWAGVTGFSEIGLNKGYYDHKAYYREVLSGENGMIYRILEADPSAKLVAFGTHPDCLQFPCIAQSYNDITSPWGNVEIVNSSEAMEEYLKFFEADYVYADAAHLSEDAWQWSKGLLEDLKARGVLYDLVFDGENWLARVRR